jgi:hypothetical protein
MISNVIEAHALWEIESINSLPFRLLHTLVLFVSTGDYQGSRLCPDGDGTENIWHKIKYFALLFQNKD